MTARYRIHHTSTYSYDQAVTASFNEVRQTPAAAPWQMPLESVLRVDQSSWQLPLRRLLGHPGAGRSRRTRRTANSSSTSPASVEVDALAAPASRPASSAGTTCATPRSPTSSASSSRSRPFTAPPADLAELAPRPRAAVQTPHDAVHAIAGAVHETMTYVPGSTGVHTLAAEAWAARSGVCQDYAHLVVGALRSIGIPARYVSGYLHPQCRAGGRRGGHGREPRLGAVVAGRVGRPRPDQHAPRCAERHVLVGAGRDYRDVPPIKGIVAGTPVTTDLDVEVTITRLA